MAEIPNFRLFGEGEPDIDRAIQPALTLRPWGALGKSERETVLQELKNRGWAKTSKSVWASVDYLNRHYLRRCPGKNLHAISPSEDYYGPNNDTERMKAALRDFQTILLAENDDALVLKMLSKFAEVQIDPHSYRAASQTTDASKKTEFIAAAFKDFDRLANCLNHIFEQFAVNQVVTRNGFVPRQDKKITDEIYSPTLSVPADPKWKTVSDDLAKMFEDYRGKNYPEVITKAHSVVQRFLQVLVGEEGKSGQGELGKLFTAAKQQGIIPVNRFTEPLVGVIQSFIPSERATNSTAKPALKEASPADALLMMNVVMIFLQFCLQNTAK